MSSEFTSASTTPQDRLAGLIQKNASGGDINSLIEKLRQATGRGATGGPAGPFQPKRLRVPGVANTGKPENLTSKLAKPPEG